MINYPKFQYSKFVGQDQIVVRADEEEEFKKLVKFVDDFKNPNLKPRYQSTAPPVREVKSDPGVNVSADEFELNHICPTHGTQMKERTGKAGQKWYDHRMQDEKGKWLQCAGKGWK